MEGAQGRSLGKVRSRSQSLWDHVGTGVPVRPCVVCFEDMKSICSTVPANLLKLPLLRPVVWKSRVEE
jgi:hypothetical protein